MIVDPKLAAYHVNNSTVGEAVEIGLLQSLYFWVNLLMEIPSGYLADRYKRKYSVTGGHLVAFLVYVLFPHAETFWTFLGLLSAFAVAMALKSGADQAVIYDSLATAGAKWDSRAKRVFARAAAIGTVAMGTSSVIGTYLMTMSWTAV